MQKDMKYQEGNLYITALLCYAGGILFLTIGVKDLLQKQSVSKKVTVV